MELCLIRCIWNELGSRFLELKGITPEANLKDILAPLSINQAIKYIAETYQLKEPLDVLINEVNSLLNHIYLSEIPLKPGLWNLLLTVLTIIKTVLINCK